MSRCDILEVLGARKRYQEPLDLTDPVVVLSDFIPSTRQVVVFVQLRYNTRPSRFLLLMVFESRSSFRLNPVRILSSKVELDNLLRNNNNVNKNWVTISATQCKLVGVSLVFFMCLEQHGLLEAERILWQSRNRGCQSLLTRKTYLEKFINFPSD
ncbi:hypothetical protein ACJ72_07707 [Emergomyces africanus]|uniref:Uncharacterized protein n=1 Tax=Emergomyces africanus TaxID=1955775 RepID=A0A1B7NMJ0_9EURO|nr:hypothetical protein ACJ72_07707 [Emergomyces africanus]